MVNQKAVLFFDYPSLAALGTGVEPLMPDPVAWFDSASPGAVYLSRQSRNQTGNTMAGPPMAR